MKKIYRILGKRGRTTIPLPLRVGCGFKPGDIISFEVRKDGTVLLRKEQPCDRCREKIKEDRRELPLAEVLDGISVAEQKAAFRLLAKRLAEAGEL